MSDATPGDLPRVLRQIGSDEYFHNMHPGQRIARMLEETRLEDSDSDSSDGESDFVDEDANGIGRSPGVRKRGVYAGRNE